MIDELNELKRQYQRIEAPPYLATRIRADVTQRPVRSRAWMPITATLMVAVTAVWLLPMLQQQPSTQVVVPSRPSLSGFAKLKPAKPTVAAPNLSNMRSVSTPRMPSKPVAKPATKPQSRIEIQNDEIQENHHV